MIPSTPTLPAMGPVIAPTASPTRPARIEASWATRSRAIASVSPAAMYFWKEASFLSSAIGISMMDWSAWPAASPAVESAPVVAIAARAGIPTPPVTTAVAIPGTAVPKTLAMDLMGLAANVPNALPTSVPKGISLPYCFFCAASRSASRASVSLLPELKSERILVVATPKLSAALRSMLLSTSLPIYLVTPPTSPVNPRPISVATSPMPWNKFVEGVFAPCFLTIATASSTIGPETPLAAPMRPSREAKSASISFFFS